MKSRLLKLLLSATTMCSTVYFANAENTIQLGNNNFSADTLIHVTVGPGVQTTGIRLKGTDASNSAVETNIFYTSVDLRNPDLVLTGVQALDTERASETVLAMGDRKNRKGELQYIAGVNGDHANLNGTQKRTNGIAFIENMLYNTGAGDTGWKRFGSYVTVSSDADIRITGQIDLSLPMSFPNGQMYDIHINSQRNEDYLVIYTPEHGATTGTNPWGKECTMRLVSGSIPECNAVFEITSIPVGSCNNNPADGNMAIPSNGYVLSGVGSAFSIVGRLTVGDRIGLNPVSLSVNGQRLNSVTTVIGGCPIIVSNGKPISAEECKDLYNTTLVQITPTARTAIGYDSETNIMFLVVTDSYKSNGCATGIRAGYGANSSGLDFRTLAEFMIYLGCQTATAMDGGGSSQLYNNKLGICNIPYGLASYLRPVANGFFAASSTPADSKVAAIEVLQKNVKLNSGESFTPTVYGYNRYGVLVSTNVTGCSFNVNSVIGTVNGLTLTAGSRSCSTTGVVTCGDMKCGVRISVNGGGKYVSSGDTAPTEVKPPYLDDDTLGVTEITTTSDDTPTYYNLQGIPVRNPRPGTIYIVRRGNQAEKIYLEP